MSENVTGWDLQHPTHVFAYAKAAVGREYAYWADIVIAKAKATVDMLVLSVNSGEGPKGFSVIHPSP